MPYSDRIIEAAYHKKYNQKRTEKLKHQGVYITLKHKTYIRNVVRNMWYRAKTRAAEKGLEFNILVEDIIIPEMCPVFGIPLMIGVGRGPKDQSPTLDRIDNSKGYIRGNIHVISGKANFIKSKYTYEEILQVGQYFQTINNKVST